MRWLGYFDIKTITTERVSGFFVRFKSRHGVYVMSKDAAFESQ
jgi:hypothetical protein